MITKLLHLFGMLVYAYSFYWLYTINLFNVNMLFMFTIWTNIAVFCYFTFAFLMDILPQLRKKCKIFQRELFNVALIMAIGCSCIFWGLFLYEQDLILPKKLNFPNTLNHIQHSLPMILMLMEMSLVKHEISSIGSMIVVTSYFVAIGSRFLSTGWLPYPFMKNFNIFGFLIFCLIGLGLAWVLGIVMKFINNLVHSKPKKQ